MVIVHKTMVRGGGGVPHGALCWWPQPTPRTMNALPRKSEPLDRGPSQCWNLVSPEGMLSTCTLPILKHQCSLLLECSCIIPETSDFLEF
jgi:hypothetical protein